MKRLFKAMLMVSIILTIGSVNVFASNVQNNSAKTEEYNQKAATIRAEINTYTTQIKELRDYNSKVNAKLKELNKKYKTDKSVIDSDKMKQIKELRKSIKNREKKEKTVTEDESIKSLVKSGQYDKALEKLNKTLEAKKNQLKVLQERNAIWHQIDALIG